MRTDHLRGQEREYRREYRRILVASGLCIECKGELQRGMRCQRCADRNARNQRRRMRKMKEQRMDALALKMGVVR